MMLELVLLEVLLANHLYPLGIPQYLFSILLWALKQICLPNSKSKQCIDIGLASFPMLSRVCR